MGSPVAYRAHLRGPFGEDLRLSRDTGLGLQSPLTSSTGPLCTVYKLHTCVLWPWTQPSLLLLDSGVATNEVFSLKYDSPALTSITTAEAMCISGGEVQRGTFFAS